MNQILEQTVDLVDEVSKKIDLISEIILELDARENSNNCVVDSLLKYSWNELCDIGSDLFKEMKSKEDIKDSYGMWIPVQP